MADFDARWYKGATLHEVHQRLESIPVLYGIAETVGELRVRGYTAVIDTVAWRFAAEWFQNRYGFDRVSGPDIERDDGGRFTGMVTEHFDEHDKLAFVQEMAAGRRLPMSECIAIGDGRSDVPLFREVGLSIALNGIREARVAATRSLTSTDLRDVLPLIPG